MNGLDNYTYRSNGLGDCVEIKHIGSSHTIDGLLNTVTQSGVLISVKSGH